MPFDRGWVSRAREEVRPPAGYRRVVLVDEAQLTRGLAWIRHHPTVADAVLAVALFGASLLSLYAWFELQRQDPSFEPEGGRPILVLAAVTLPLAFRRRFPLAAAAAVVVAFSLGRMWLSAPDEEQYLVVWACWLALYSAAVHRRPGRWTGIALAGISLALVAEIVRELFFDELVLKDLPLTQWVLLAYNLAVLIALPLLLGLAVRALRQRQQQLAAQTAELQRERNENARRAVLEERVRIARELHDVVAHHVSVMGVQAGAARRVLERRPEQAMKVLSSIEDSSRQAVLELQRLLGFLRRPDQQDDLAPQPNLAQLPELIHQAGQGGLDVELLVDGDQRSLAPTLELSAYRVVQEALTNALKHSGGTHATVKLDYRPTALDVEVVDDGGTTAGRTPANTGGHGLIGMRERVVLHGGHLRAGPRPQGGFAVHATFPLNGAAP